MEKQTFYGHGKLLLTGEYAVLDGTMAFALPTKFGQRLEISPLQENKNQIVWESFDHNNEKWLHAELPPQNYEQQEIATLQHIFKAIDKLNPIFFEGQNFHCRSFLEFPQNWGLGSSSTLIYTLAKWTNVNPYELLQKTFGGSGYDIACAGSETPLLFYIKNEEAKWENIEWNFPEKEKLYFVHLGKKKNSREAIQHYREEKSTPIFVDKMSSLTHEFVEAQNIEALNEIITEHESILSERLKTLTVKQERFHNFEGNVKSLGGWGGDFVLATCTTDEADLKAYFKNKGLDTILPFNEMIL